MKNVKIRYAVVFWRGSARQFKSFVQLADAREFCDAELANRRDCRMLQYDALKHSAACVRDKTLAYYNGTDEAVKEAGAASVSNPTCEFCGKAMVLRFGRHGKFYGCPGYPGCRGTKPVGSDARPARTTGTAHGRRSRST